MEHWLEREIAQWVHHEGLSIRRPIAPRANVLTTELHLAPSHCSSMARTDIVGHIILQTTDVLNKEITP